MRAAAALSGLARAASVTAILHAGVVNIALAEDFTPRDAAGAANSSLFKPQVSDLYTGDAERFDVPGIEAGEEGMSAQEFFGGVEPHTGASNALPEVDTYEDLYSERDARVEALSRGEGEFAASGRNVEQNAYDVLEQSEGVSSVRGKAFLERSTSLLTREEAEHEFGDCTVERTTGMISGTYDDYTRHICERSTVQLDPVIAERAYLGPDAAPVFSLSDGNTRCRIGDRSVAVGGAETCRRLGALVSIPSAVNRVLSCAPDAPGADLCLRFAFDTDAAARATSFDLHEAYEVVEETVGEADTGTHGRNDLQLSQELFQDWTYDEGAWSELQTLTGTGYCSYRIDEITAAPHAGEGSTAEPFATASPFATGLRIVPDCTVGGSYETSNTCTPYAERTDCIRTGRTCLAEVAGACRTWEENWSCGQTRTYETPVVDEVNICSSAMTCEGGDCFPDTSTSGAEAFAETAARLSAAEMMAADMTCTDDPANEETPRQCTVFDGEGETCDKVVLGLSNCCETPEGVSMVDYIQLAFAVSRLNSIFMDAGQSNLLTSTWGTMETTARDSFSALSRPLTETWDSVIGNSAATKGVAPEAARGMVGAAKQQMMKSTAEWTAQVFGDQAANAIFANAAGGGAAIEGGQILGDVVLSTGAQTVMSAVTTAYSVYVISSMLVDILLKCSDSELELGVSRAIKATHEVGTYCSRKVLGFCVQRKTSYCEFSSPLSRIMNEEIRKQTGRGWGSAETPDCDGFNVDDLQDVDFDALDLSEWTGMLASSGVVDPTGVTPDTLTGEDSTLGVGLSDLYTRENAVERSQNKLDGTDTYILRRDATHDFGRGAIQE